MSTITIIHRATGATIHSGEYESLRSCVIALVAKHASLGGASLGGASLGGASLGGAYLSGANLRDAYLRDAYLGGANLSDAYLRGANLRGANLRGAYLRGVDLGGADLRDTDLISLPVGDPRGYAFFAQLCDDGWRLHAEFLGPRTLEEARAYWAKDAYIGDPEIGELYRRALKWWGKSKQATRMRLAIEAKQAGSTTP